MLKWDRHEVCKLIVEGHLQELHEIYVGYPQKVTEFDYQNNLHLSRMNGAVWDIKLGILLKLGEDNEIQRAIKGWDILSKD